MKALTTALALSAATAEDSLFQKSRALEEVGEAKVSDVVSQMGFQNYVASSSTYNNKCFMCVTEGKSWNATSFAALNSVDRLDHYYCTLDDSCRYTKEDFYSCEQGLRTCFLHRFKHEGDHVIDNPRHSFEVRKKMSVTEYTSTGQPYRSTTYGPSPESLSLSDETGDKDHQIPFTLSKERVHTLSLINAQEDNYAYYQVLIYRKNGLNWDLVSWQDDLYKQVLVAKYNSGSGSLDLEPIVYGYPLSGKKLVPVEGKEYPLMVIGRNYLKPKSAL